jgi:hypothetical protein
MARQNLYDSLLALLPPLGASLYLLGFFYGFAPGAGAAVLAVTVFVAAGLLVAIRSRRAGASRVYYAARLLDEKAKGKERFVTLATLGPSVSPPFLLGRLRQEAARLGARVDLGRDFPYRVKRSFLVSLIASLMIVLGLHLLPRMRSQVSSDPGRIRQAAEELSRTPRLAEWARTLQTLADRLQDENLSANEKRQLVQQALQTIEKQLGKNRQQGGGGEELGEAAEILRGVEQELGKSGGQGGVKTNLPQTGEGKEKGLGSGGGSGDDRKSSAEEKEGLGGEKAQRPDKATETKSGEGGRGGEKNGGEGREGKNDQVGLSGKEKGESGGKSKVGEEIPKGASPEPYGEKAGAGLKDGRFVTVQLPEEETGKSTGAGDSEKRREVRPKVPVGNVPLGRPETPDAHPERQHVPLEYRGMIR